MRLINKINGFVMPNGERYSLLVNAQSGLPLYYPNLFVTTQVRNRSLSHSTMVSSLDGIAALLNFMAIRNDNIEARFVKHQFFDINELDAIRDYCQHKFRDRRKNADVNGKFTPAASYELVKKVSSNTQYVRLTIISHYIKWLAELLSGEAREKNVSIRIAKMAKGLKARRPIRKNRNDGLVEKGLDKKQLEILFELFRPESDLNPFENKFVKVRNRLMFLVLFHLGLRGGELLNIRIRDIDFNCNHLKVVRRADEKDDPRIVQPRAKTRDRLLPLKDTLVKEIHSYIVQARKKIVRPGQPDFLFVTHKEGPTKGLPISISGYRKVMNVVRMVSPILFNFTGHQLRHAWNEKFSELMDTMDSKPNEELQEEMRSNIMGWRPGSGTAASYNKRFIRRKAQEAALALQEGMVRLPKGLSHE